MSAKVGLLNVDGYIDALLDKALADGFLDLASHSIVVSAPTAAALLNNLKVSELTDNSNELPIRLMMSRQCPAKSHQLTVWICITSGHDTY